jgi:NAD(P)-dependent dehydrogenase (short-subunit alcohol dehydrogenase family)
MDLGLKDKAVLVTGGSKGIGYACALAFLREGARVAIVSRSEDNLVTAKAQFAAQGFEVATIAAELSDPAQAQRAVAEAEQALGPLDVLLNSAGAAKRRPTAEMDAEAWNAGLNAKFFPTIHTQDAVLARWRERAAAREPAGTTRRPSLGAIVNIVGSGGKHPTATHLAGGAANAALMLTTVGFAHYYAKLGIRINAINPGFTLTGRVNQNIELEAQRLGVTFDEALAKSQASIPLGRYGDPDEIAAVAVFLASEQASYVIGTIVTMDGGANSSL